jgi:signal transduction histidine kinase
MKLAIGFAVIATSVFVVGIISLYHLDRSYTDAIEIHGKPLAQIGYALGHLQEARLGVRGAIIYAGDQEELRGIETTINQNLQKFETLMKGYGTTIRRDDAHKLYEESLNIYYEDFKPLVSKVIEDAKKGVDREELTKNMWIAKTTSDVAVEKIFATMEIKEMMLGKTGAACTFHTNVISIVFLAILAAEVLIAVLLMWYINDRVNQPLALLMVFMERASTTGDFAFIPDEAENFDRFARRNDEVGRTIASCVQFIERVTDTSDGLQTIANGNLSVELPLLSDKDTIGLSMKKMTSGLRFMMDKIESLLEESQAASQAKSEFMARMSHEMLTPMNAIIGLMQVVKQIGEPNQISEYLDIMDNASHQLLQQIHDVLDMSGMESSILQIASSAFSFQTMFDEAQHTVRRAVKEKNQEFTCDLDPTIPQTLIGDKKRLEKVINILLDNAVKFTPEQGKIHFAAKMLGEDSGNIVLQIEVADNGIGIASDQQHVLFDLFEQVDGGNTRKYGGIGLGLSLAQRIVEAMGGKIWVDSELGKGATFTFTCVVKEPE